MKKRQGARKIAFVRIEVRGGIAYIAEKTTGVEVHLVDYDEMDTNNEIDWRSNMVYAPNRRITRAKNWRKMEGPTLPEAGEVVELRFRNNQATFGKLVEDVENGVLYWQLQGTDDEVAMFTGPGGGALPAGKKVVAEPIAWRE